MTFHTCLDSKADSVQERLQAGQASEQEYKIENAHDIAIKVLSTRDDYELPVVTFRMLFLGLGFSAFGYAPSTNTSCCMLTAL